MPRRWGKAYLWVELVVLFLVAPVAVFFVRRQVAGLLIPGLLLLGTGCAILLWFDPAFDRRRLWNARGLRQGITSIALRFLPGALVLAALTVVFDGDRFLALPRERPATWLMILALYPLLSVYPQELIFRAFFFHRYRCLVPSGTWMILASGLAFAVGHLFFANWIALALTLAGGLLFARTYERSGSTLQAVLEHGLWGDFLFTVGLGWYFYTGSIGT